jgi:hypothetical protein
MTTQTNSDTSTKDVTYPRILIQPDWSVNLKSNGSKALTGEDATAYKTSASDNFQSGDIDRKRRQLRIKTRDTDFVHTFQGKLIILFFLNLNIINNQC